MRKMMAGNEKDDQVVVYTFSNKIPGKISKLESLLLQKEGD